MRSAGGVKRGVDGHLGTDCISVSEPKKKIAQLCRDHPILLEFCEYFLVNEVTR